MSVPFDRYGDVGGMCGLVEYLHTTGCSVVFYGENRRTGSSLLGGGYGFTQLIVQVVVAFYVAMLTLVVMCRKQYSKIQFWLLVVLCVCSYVLPVVCMYGLGAPKSIIKYTWVSVSVVWSIVAVVMTYKGFRRLEFK